MTTIAAELPRLKGRLPDLIAPSFIEPLMAKLPIVFRVRILTPVVVVQLLVLRVLEANTAYAHLPHLANLSFTASSFCQALARLPLELLQSVLAAVAAEVDKNSPAAATRFSGHRVLLADASCLSMPDTPALATHYGYAAGQKPGLGFPVAKLLVLLDLSTGLIRRVLIHPYRTHEVSRTRELHPELKPGDILVGDRAYASYVHLSRLLAQSFHGLFRLHQRLSWTLAGTPGERRHHLQARIVKTFSRHDRLIVYRKPLTRPVWMSVEEYAAIPGEILVRELRYGVLEKGFRSREVMLVTTLLDLKRYPRRELANLYGLRWRIENQFRHLKSTLKMAVLKGKSVAIIEREILAYVLAYNLIAREIRQAAAVRDVTPERISFLDAVRWMLAGMKAGALLLINPLRPGRIEPRARKRRMINYPYMTRPREVMKRELFQLSEKLVRLT